MKLVILAGGPCTRTAEEMESRPKPRSAAACGGGGREATAFHGARGEPWAATLADTGVVSMVGGRAKWVRRPVGDEGYRVLATLSKGARAAGRRW